MAHAVVDDLEIRPDDRPAVERQRSICETVWSSSKARPRHLALHCAAITTIRDARRTPPSLRINLTLMLACALIGATVAMLLNTP